jgi:glycerophosphoryl diester phosphodiesterase
MMSRRDAMTAGMAAGLAAAAPALARGGRGGRPLVLAHRGCSALRPEHTLAAYAKAIADGADYVEPDLVISRDGVLLARHENNLADTTDIAARPDFAARRTERLIDGRRQTGWFTEDFTLAELKSLRAVERLGPIRPESRAHDGRYEIPTLAELLDLVTSESAVRGRPIGIIPEIKHPGYFAGIGLAIEARLLDALATHAEAGRIPVEIQSFETANLRALRARIGRASGIGLMQLIGAPHELPADVAAAGGGTTYAAMTTPEGLAEIAGYADGVGFPARLLIPLDAAGRLGAPTRLVADAHAAGLRAGAYTFRPENRFLPADLRDGGEENARNEAGSIAEMRRHLALGLDSFFTDDPALGRRAVDGD